MAAIIEKQWTGIRPEFNVEVMTIVESLAAQAGYKIDDSYRVWANFKNAAEETIYEYRDQVKIDGVVRSAESLAEEAFRKIAK